MAIYTRTGDKGETSVIGGRVGKDDVRVEAYGTIDELNCFVGQARSLMEDERFADVREQLLEIQHELFDCGSDLAFVKISESKYKVKSEMAVRLEGWIDELQAENPVLERFILLAWQPAVLSAACLPHRLPPCRAAGGYAGPQRRY